MTINGQTLDPKQVQEMINKAKAEGRTEVRGDNFVSTFGSARAGALMSVPAKRMAIGKGEALGKKNMEGVIAEGTRNVQTIEAGEIGNDRPIQIVNEQWYSEELGMMVMTRRSDPRTGDETFRVTNIRRGDPAPYLFQPPAGATINESKM
jgi:hypothetical protein